MKVTLRLDDEVFEKYEKQVEKLAGSGKTVSVEDLLERQLERFAGISGADRPLVIRAEQRARLERLFQGGFIKDDEDLVKRVEALAVLEIQDVRVYFTPGQLHSLKRFASKNAKSLEEATNSVVQSMAARFFDYVPGA